MAFRAAEVYAGDQKDEAGSEEGGEKENYDSAAAGFMSSCSESETLNHFLPTTLPATQKSTLRYQFEHDHIDETAGSVHNSGFETPTIAKHHTRQEPDLEGGENGAEPEPSPPSSSQRLSGTLRRSLFLDAATHFKDKGMQTPEHSEPEADSLRSEPIENEALNEAKDEDEENEQWGNK